VNRPGDISPEEKLLRLIKNKSTSKEKDSRAKAGIGAEGNVPQETFAGLQSSAVSPKISQGLERINFNLINNILMILSSFLLLYILADFFFFVPSYRSELQRLKRTIRQEGPDILDVVTPLPYSYYSAQLEGKNLFKAAMIREDTAGSIPKKELRDLIKNLTLMGIISEEEPQAIIEDKSTGKSYFLKKGELINGVKIVEIKSNKVVLEYEEQRFDLYL